MSDLLTSNEMVQNSWIEDLVTGIINLLDSLLVLSDILSFNFLFSFCQSRSFHLIGTTKKCIDVSII